jgi:hypothetical protein
MAYEKTIGRVAVEVNSNGAKQHDYGHGCTVSCRAGWNNASEVITLTMSVEELRDLQYILGRAIAAAEKGKEGA